MTLLATFQIYSISQDALFIPQSLMILSDEKQKKPQNLTWHLRTIKHNVRDEDKEV